MKTFFLLVKQTFRDWSDDKAPRLAAALAYYTVFSLAPLLVLVIAIASFVVGNNVNIRQSLITQVQSMVGQQAAASVNDMINVTSQPRNGTIATIVGIVTLLLGATGLFGQLQDALNTIWEVKPKANRGIMGMLTDRFLSFTMVLGISFLLLVSLVVSAGLSFVNSYFTNLLGNMGFLAQVLNFVISTGIITLIFALIFKILPDAEVEWEDVWIGALVTALLFNLGKWLLSIYLSRGSVTSAYGAAGSLIILLLWVYYSAQILFLGAEFTQAYAKMTGKEVRPSKHARKVTDEERITEGLPARKTQAAVATPQSAAIQGAMIPVAGQPRITVRPEQELETARRERLRYEPPAPGKVVPVIALGTVAGVVAIGRMIRRIFS
jgi:membrane protein